MGDWLISADLLARSRFTVSPLHETLAAMFMLDPTKKRQLEPWQRAFCGTHQEAFAQMLERHPVRRELLAWAWRPRRGNRPGWTADFLTAAPPHTDPSFEEEVAALDDWTEADMRAELESIQSKPVPDLLRQPVLPDEMRALLEWVWTVTVSADWPRRRRILEADIVARTSRLATKGWAGVVGDLNPNTEWLGEGRLRINNYDLPARDLGDATDLFLVPAHATGSWVAWTPPTRYALVYPVTGSLAPPDRATDDGLTRLIGPNRAWLLVALDTPRSTTQLASLSGLPVGSVGNHLRVLLDAGAVLRRRSGREVLYWRTSMGDALCATGELSRSSSGTRPAARPAGSRGAR
jgi:DNA-binding transcriptional ArsR family regulator